MKDIRTIILGVLEALGPQERLELLLVVRLGRKVIYDSRYASVDV